MKAALLSRRTILAASIDTEAYVEEAFAAVVSKGHHTRRDAYEILSMHLEDASNHNNKRCIPLIEKLPTLLETIQPSEYDPLLKCFSTLAENSASDIQNAWNKNMNKLVTNLLRLLGHKYEKSRTVFYARVLYTLATSRIRNTLVPFIRQVKESMFHFLSYQHRLQDKQREILTDVLAAFIALEAPHQWNLSLGEIVAEMAVVLNRLTIFAALAKHNKQSSSSTSTQAPTNAMLMEIDSAIAGTVGVVKVQILEGLFVQLNRLYSKILRNGCTASFVSVDLTPFSLVARSILPYYADVDPSDPATFIENESHISKVDVALVSSGLKAAVLQSIRCILSLQLPGMMRYGSHFLQPVCVLLGRKEVHQVPVLLEEVLRTVQAAAVALPHSLVSVLQATGAMQVLIQLMQVHCQLIAAPRKLFTALDTSKGISAGGNSKSEEGGLADGNLLFSLLDAQPLSSSKRSHHATSSVSNGSSVLGKRSHCVDSDVESRNDDLSVLVLSTLDSLLLHGGRYLLALQQSSSSLSSSSSSPANADSSILLKVQTALYQPLLVLQRGLLPAQCHDKKMHRLFAERIRHSAVLQAAVLKSASTLLLVTGGAAQGFLTLLRVVAPLVLQFAGDHADAKNAAQHLLLLSGHLLHPSVLPLPSHTPAVLAAEYVSQETKRRRKEAQAQEMESSQKVGTNSNSELTQSVATDVSLEASSGQLFSISAVDSNTAAKASAIDLSVKKSTVAVPLRASSTVPTTQKTSKATASAAVAVTSQAQVTENEDDDDIPDIDMSSDQE